MPQQYINFAFVKQGANFEAVLSHYELKAEGTGVERSVLCPFHNERKPSCKIELERKIFQCFGCGTKGNILEFVALMEGNRADLRSAAFTLAGICKIPVAPPRGTGNVAGARERRKGRPGPAATSRPRTGAQRRSYGV